MEDNDLMDFVKVYNDAEPGDKPTTAMEWILFLDKNGFRIAKKYAA